MGRDVATDGDPGPGLPALSGRLFAGAITDRLLDLAESLGPDADAREARDAAVEAEPGRDEEGGLRALASLPSRAAADAAGALAAALVPAIVERIDVNALLAKIDVDELVARIDVDRILDSIDIDRLLDRVDFDEIVGRVDLGAIAREAIEGIDLPDLIQESTAGIGSEALEAVRVQAMRADDLLARIVDTVLFRRRARATGLEERG